MIEFGRYKSNKYMYGININGVEIFIDDNNKIMFAYPYMSAMLNYEQKRAIYDKYEYYDINKKNNIREVNNNIKLSWLYNKTLLHEVYYNFIHNIHNGDHYVQNYFILEGLNIKLEISCGHYYDAVIFRTPGVEKCHISLKYSGIEHLEYIYNFLNLMDIHVHMYECNREYNNYNKVFSNIMMNSNIDYDEATSIMSKVKVIAKCDKQYEYEKIKIGNLLVTPISIEEYDIY